MIIAFSKGKKAKPRDLVYEIGKTVLLGRTQPIKATEFVNAVALEIESTSADAECIAEAKRYLTMNAKGIIRQITAEQ